MRGCRSPTKLLSFHIDIFSFFFCNFAGAMMPVIIDTRVPRHTGLNRTFYGIETCLECRSLSQNAVLIVPFMELKPSPDNVVPSNNDCLNRTFYGIETSARSLQWRCLTVLIVPFMELKLD